MAHALKVSHMLYSGCQCQHRVKLSRWAWPYQGQLTL